MKIVTTMRAGGKVTINDKFIVQPLDSERIAIAYKSVIGSGIVEQLKVNELIEKIGLEPTGTMTDIIDNQGHLYPAKIAKIGNKEFEYIVLDIFNATTIE